MKKFLTTSASALLLLIVLCVSAVGSAQDSNGAIAKGFQPEAGSDPIVTGALVSFAADDSQHIALTDTSSADRLLGIVDKNPLLAISSDNDEVQVVLSGAANALVSDINGVIHAGDKVAASPVAGIGMRASGDGQVVGTAQADFNTSTSQSRTVKDKDGVERTIHIGYIPVQAGVSFYQAPGSDLLPPFVQNLANSIAGRPVSVVRILICSALLLTAFISIAVLVYTAVRSAMTSVGRNPLAASAIRKSLYQVGALVVAVAAGTLFAGYLILSI